MPVIGITGYKGRLGSQLLTYSDCVPLECDITNVESVKAVIASEKPDVIINCAAYTQVDRAEIEYDKAIAVNTHGVYNLIRSFEGRLIHLSTDYVFDGKSGPYDERKRSHDPFNRYGWSKAGGEIACWYASWDKVIALVVRTTGLFGGKSGKEDFASFVLRSLDEKKSIKVSDELIGNQTYIPYLANKLHLIAEENFLIRDTINIASLDIMSRYQFALLLADEFGMDRSLIIPVENRDINEWCAFRPSRGGLLLGKAHDIFFPVETISDGIKAYKEALG